MIYKHDTPNATTNSDWNIVYWGVEPQSPTNKNSQLIRICLKQVFPTSLIFWVSVGFSCATAQPNKLTAMSTGNDNYEHLWYTWLTTFLGHLIIVSYRIYNDITRVNAWPQHFVSLKGESLMFAHVIWTIEKSTQYYSVIKHEEIIIS